MNGLYCKILKYFKKNSNKKNIKIIVFRADFEPLKLFYSRDLNRSISSTLNRSPDKRPSTNEILLMALFHKQNVEEPKKVLI